MASKECLVLLLTLICVGVRSQLAPVYNPGGVEEQTFTPTLRNAASRAINVVRPRRNQLVTETVYGFLDFTTTVGSTVMIFTPQSEKEKATLPSTSVATVTATTVSSKVETTNPPVIHQNVENPEKAEQATLLASTKASTAAPSGLARLLQEALSLKETKAKSFSSKPPRNFHKKSEPSGNRNRDFQPFIKRNPSSVGGLTIVPITVEGKGGILPPRTPALEPSIYVPDEVVISASQRFPHVSVIGPFDNELRNVIKNTHKYNHVTSSPTPALPESHSLAKLKFHKPTGLVTTVGGTVISDGQTTIYKTSIIGTYVSGKYAQILKTTSKILQENLSENLITPTNKYETIKAVIEGSATQFFKPEHTASLPIESLFSSARAPRNEALDDPDTKLSKRRGTNPNVRDDYYYYDNKDHYYDDEYDDLVRSGTGVRQSYRPVETPRVVATPSPPRKSEPSTYRPQFKPTGTRRMPPSFLRNSPPPENRKNTNRFQLSRPNLKVNRRPIASKPKEEVILEPEVEIKYPSSVNEKGTLEETVRLVTRTPEGSSNVWFEIATLRSLHTFRVGTALNSRLVTYTKTFTHSIEPTAALEVAGSEKSAAFEEPPLFENILDDKTSEIATLPPIDIGNSNLKTLLKTTTETFKTVETMYKTSVLPVKESTGLHYHTLVQTYFITRIVSAIKTIPPAEVFEFVPSDSLNEFNSRLIAEGTENEAALLPGEQEYDENSETRVPPPPGFKLPDSDLADLAGGKFNPEALEKQTNPQLVAALKTIKDGSAPELSGTKETLPTATSAPTPALSPEALQMAYLRLMNPYMFGGFPGIAQQTSVSSSPVVITTDVTTTATRVLRVIFNARPILTTISSTDVVRTTITSYLTTTVTAQPGLAGLPFPFAPALPFPAG